MTGRESLLKELEAAKIDFDPTADHNYGTSQPAKVAFVPVALFRDLLAYLKNIPAR